MVRKNILKRLASFSVVALVALALCGFGSVALAETGEGIKLSPVKDELMLKPGETYKGEIKVENLNSDKVDLQLETMNFTASGTGTPVFNDEEGGTFGLKSWIKLSQDELAMAPGVEKTVKFEINVPGNAEPGGHYGAVLVGEKSKTESTTKDVSINGKVAYLLLVTVDGDMKVGGDLKSFSTDKSSYNVPEVDFEMEYANTGNVHIKPAGSIEITNWSGEVVGEVKVNKDGGNVLPKETRKYMAEWKEGGTRFGKFKAELSLAVDSPNGETVKDSAVIYFWILPWKLILLFVLVVVVVVVLAALALKGYKESILKKSGKSKK